MLGQGSGETMDLSSVVASTDIARVAQSREGLYPYRGPRFSTTPVLATGVSVSDDAKERPSSRTANHLGTSYETVFAPADRVVPLRRCAGFKSSGVRLD